MLREQRRQHPPSELKRRRARAEGHVGVQIEAYPSTINVTEAIFEFPPYTLDIQLQKAIFDLFSRSQKWPKRTLLPSISLV